MTTSPIERPEGRDITFRRMRFDFEDGFERYWHGGSPFMSFFFSQLSTAFQPGEKFFVDSARALRHTVQDPALLEELRVFCQQEGHHTAQHLKFDRLNRDMGVDVDACRRRYARWLGVARRHSALHMLGVTCALEHFTSGFADLWHRRPDLSDGADPRVNALWSWHAAEEAEHRGTCFDIYEAAGGSYPLRVVTLVESWFLILAVSIVNTFVLLAQDRKLFTRDTLHGLWRLFGWRGYVLELVPTFLRYLRPGFRPWSEPVALGPAEIRAWQARNERYIVNLGPPASAVGSAPASPAPAT